VKLFFYFLPTNPFAHLNLLYQFKLVPINIFIFSTKIEYMGNDRQKLRGTEKVNRLGLFILFRGKQVQKLCEPIRFLDIESTRNVDNSKSYIEIKSKKMKQVKAEGTVISSALGPD